MYEVEEENENSKGQQQVFRKDVALIDSNKNYRKVIHLLRDVRETTNAISNENKTETKRSLGGRR